MSGLQEVGRGFVRALAGLLLLGALAPLASCQKLASLAKPKPAAVFKRPRVDAALARMQERLAQDPKFSEAIKRASTSPQDEKLDLAVNTSGYRELGAQLAAKGTARLSPVEFLQLIKLKLKLAEKSPKLCAGFWSGGIDMNELGAGLDALDDTELERWFELSERATRAELYATTPLPRFAGKVLVDGFRDISAALPPAESEAFAATLREGAKAPPAAGCDAYLKLTRGALVFPDPRRDTFLRGLMFDTLVDW